MKRYLNKDEKHMMLVFGSFTSYLRDKIKELEPVKSKPQDLMKNLKMAATYGEKAISCVMGRLDREEGAKLLKEIPKMQVASRYNGEAIKEYKDLLQMDRIIPMEKDDFDDIVCELVEHHCRKCAHTGEPAESCHFKKLMIKYDIQPPNLSAEFGTCPYKY